MMCGLKCFFFKKNSTNIIVVFPQRSADTFFSSSWFCLMVNISIIAVFPQRSANTLFSWSCLI
jgi:hypothetical protein